MEKHLKLSTAQWPVVQGTVLPEVAKSKPQTPRINQQRQRSNSLFEGLTGSRGNARQVTQIELRRNISLAEVAQPHIQKLNQPEKSHDISEARVNSQGNSLSATFTEKSLESSDKEILEINIPELREKLTSYAEYIKNCKKEGIAPDETNEFIEKDEELIHIFAAAENQRKPGLNLKVFNERNDFLSHLSNLREQGVEEYRGRAVINFDGLHFIAADINLSKNSTADPASLTVIFSNSLIDDSSNANSLRAEIQNSYPEVITGALFIGTGVQASGSGCPIFSLSHALKFHADEKVFDQLHAEIQVDINVGNKQSSSDDKYKTWRKPLYSDRISTRLYFAEDNRAKILPSSFHKHTQSERVIEKTIKARGWGDEVLVSKKSGPKTLKARYTENLIGRTKDGDQKTHNISIEEKRLKFIKRSLAYLDALEKSKN